MREAAKLLAETDSTVNDIGSMVGYTNQFQFVPIFHKHFGVSPSTYREAVHGSA
jgi:AraC-like DNA-binding protein